MVQAMMQVGLVDRVVVRPGRREEFLRGFHQRYLPGARARGLTLVSVVAVPPEEIEAQPTELTIVWTLPDYRAFFPMRGQAGADPSVAAFWEWCNGLIERRERHVGAALDHPDTAAVGAPGGPR